MSRARVALIVLAWLAGVGLAVALSGCGTPAMVEGWQTHEGSCYDTIVRPVDRRQACEEGFVAALDGWPAGGCWHLQVNGHECQLCPSNTPQRQPFLFCDWSAP